MGLEPDLSGLKKSGRQAVLMCFVSASMEILGIKLPSPGFMGLTVLEAVIMGALAFRMLVVFICLLGTGLTEREKIFCMVTYTPKATLQTAMGGIIPLSPGFACGDIVLTAAVLAIVLTAPLGALAIDSSYKNGW